MYIKRSIFSLVMLLLFVAGWLYYIGGQYRTTTTIPSVSSAFTDLSEYAWATEAIDALVQKGVISGMTQNEFAPKENVTREQFAKMLTKAFDLPISEDKTQMFEDVPTSRWSFSYIVAAKDMMGIYETRFQPTKVVTREEAAASLVKALGLTDEKVENTNLLYDYFPDAVLVAPNLERQVIIAYQNKLISGMDGRLLPFEPIRRVDLAVMLFRALSNEIKPSSRTKIIGQSETTLEDAKRWAQSRGADESFINIADFYWKYGKQTGIRPEVLYCQAAKETNFGKYTGNVRADMNNWAGIKTAEAVGDETEAHQRFPSPEEGVIAHFNHMSAYVGLSPIGTPHPRYESVKNLPWAGTIECVEELGGKWAPDSEYGKSIVNDYLSRMVTDLK